MNFTIKPFKELLGMHFNIPNYQRGYRWEKEHVHALLNDLQEFALKDNKDKDEFYCLQPIVVRKNIFLSQEQRHDIYDLLDGQQRLTTLWIILNNENFKVLWNASDRNYTTLYDMQFESRDDLMKKAIDLNVDCLQNIDLYYLRQTVLAVDEWIEAGGDVQEIVNILVPKSINKPNTRVIWYDLTNQIATDGANQTSSIDVFSRLNYGKISLSDTELIKALMLQSDLYPDTNEAYGRQAMKERLFRISTEWDRMEKSLQNPKLWGMLAPDDYKPLSRMELLFDFVAKKVKKRNKYEVLDKNRESYFIIERYLQESPISINNENNQTQDSTTPRYVTHAERVEKLWIKVLDTFTAMNNWCQNYKVYHLVGLYALLYISKDNLLSNLGTLLNQYTTKTKKDFNKWLVNEIGKKIKVSGDIEENNVKRKKELSDISYGDDDNALRRVLTAFNVYLHMNSTNQVPFDFQKFKHFKVTSLEHIHPQNLEFKDDQMKQEDIEKWIKAERLRLTDKPLPEAERLVNELETLLNNTSRDFEEKKSEVQKTMDTIDAEHDKQAGMEKGHMHTLYNMALVDKDTNAALSNNVIDRKRSILQQRETKELTYIPLGTSYVFNKHFSDKVDDLKLWLPNDRKAYFEEVNKSYKYFILNTK